jgi:hypothetical protein
MKTKSQAVFESFSAKLIENGVVTQAECDIISRKGTRKERLWKRHVRDLAEYVINREKGMEELCKLMIEWCKQK